MIDQSALLEILDKRFSTDNKGDYTHLNTSLTSGVVVDTDDPLQNGRLRVFCPSLGDDPAKIHLLPWAVYISPYGGTIANPNFERQGESTTGSVSYGFWGIPEMGANVLAGCVDGDMRRRFWLGTMYDQQETHTIGNGRYNWSEGGTVDGPLSSANSPIQPAYGNAHTAFNGENDSPEWQSREAEYSITAVDKTLNQPPTPDKGTYLDQQFDEISNDQQFAFNQATVGSNGYDWSSFGIPFKTSKVVGISTPGFASFTMDDRRFNNRSKLRSSTGHLLLLDDTNERIYIRTATGNAWMEMDSAGNIDAYSSRRISLSSDMDVNISAGKSVRITGGEGVYIYAGEFQAALPELSEAPPIGQVRIQAQDDMHLVSNNLRQLSFQDTIFEIGANKCETVGGTSSTQVQEDINLISNVGDYNITIGGNYNLEVYEAINMFAVTSATLASKGNVEFYAYYGTVNIGAQQDITAKSISGNITMQAVGGNSSNSGAVNIKSPNSQMGVSNTGATISTNGSGGLGVQTSNGMSMQSTSPTTQSQPFPSADQVPAVDCSISKPVPLTGLSGANLAAAVAYNAGFTGQALTIAVAISGAESSFNPNAKGDVGLQTSKWGPSCGFWQVRSLVDPSAFHFPDTLRDQTELFDPQFNANAAYAFSAQGQNFSPWSTYMNGAYLNASNMNPAIAAIQALCGVATPSPSTDGMAGPRFGLSVDNIQCEGASQSVDMPMGVSPLKPTILITDTNIILQTIDDVIVNSVTSGQSVAILAGITDTSNTTVITLNEVIAALDVCCDSSIVPITPIPNAGISAPLTEIPSNFAPYVDADSEVIFNLGNFDVNGGTVIQP